MQAFLLPCYSPFESLEYPANEDVCCGTLPLNTCQGTVLPRGGAGAHFGGGDTRLSCRGLTGLSGKIKFVVIQDPLVGRVQYPPIGGRIAPVTRRRPQLCCEGAS